MQDLFHIGLHVVSVVRNSMVSSRPPEWCELCVASWREQCLLSPRYDGFFSAQDIAMSLPKARMNHNTDHLATLLWLPTAKENCSQEKIHLLEG